MQKSEFSENKVSSQAMQNAVKQMQEVNQLKYTSKSVTPQTSKARLGKAFEFSSTYTQTLKQVKPKAATTDKTSGVRKVSKSGLSSAA